MERDSLRLIKNLFLSNRCLDSTLYNVITKSNDSFRDMKSPILGSLVISFTGSDEKGIRYGFVGRIIGIDRKGFKILPIGLLSQKVHYKFQDNVYKTNDKVYPIVVTKDLIIGLGFVPYNIKGFRGYRIKIGGRYLKIKFEEYPVVGYTLKWGNNTYSGIYLHQLMEVLNLYFVL